MLRLNANVAPAFTVAADAAGSHVIQAGAPTEFARHYVVNGQLAAREHLPTVLTGERVAEKYQRLLRSTGIARHPFTQIMHMLVQNQHRRYHHADTRTVNFPVVAMQSGRCVKIQELDRLLPRNRGNRQEAEWLRVGVEQQDVVHDGLFSPAIIHSVNRFIPLRCCMMGD